MELKELFEVSINGDVKSLKAYRPENKFFSTVNIFDANKIEKYIDDVFRDRVFNIEADDTLSFWYMGRIYFITYIDGTRFKSIYNKILYRYHKEYMQLSDEDKLLLELGEE